MTKKEKLSASRKMFFTLINERYKGYSMYEDGGRWNIFIPEKNTFQLSNINYGGDIMSTSFDDRELESELQSLWNLCYWKFQIEIDSKDYNKQQMFIAGYKAMFDEIITSPWDEDDAIKAYNKWKKKNS